MDDVSFTVPRGEVAGLLGPNGSGKSTVMRCLIGFFSPTGGRVRVAGIDVGADPLEARRHLGYLPEQVTLYPDLPVRRYLEFVAGMKGIGGAARRSVVDDVIAQCGLGAVAGKLNGKLSKGYRQRVGLAQALIGDPPVLVLDEPTVGLDPVQTVELRSLLRELRGRTVLLSTHVLAEASALCRRIVILDRGRVVAEDTPEGLARRVEGLGRLVVRVDGPPEQVAQALRAIPGVEEVRAEAEDEGPGRLFVIRAADPEPVQRQLAATIVGGGWTLLEARMRTPTLEELFVRAVGR